MSWIWPEKLVKPVVKYKGKCKKRQQQKICPYWMAKHDKSNNNVIGYKCILFDLDKTGVGSLPECDAQYGTTYDGPP